MPRIPNAIILRAYAISPLLPLLIRTTRDLPSAINELRWLREYARSLKRTSLTRSRDHLLDLCRRRQRGEPLQYILGSQPFGGLDIRCKKGVLIPRHETEAYTTHLAKLLNSNKFHSSISREETPTQRVLDSKRQNECPKFSGPRPPPALNIIDLCSGSGCIPLLLHSLLSPKFPILKINAWDISTKAVSLGKANLHSNVRSGRLSQRAKQQVHFHCADIFEPPTEMDELLEGVDIMISNPPYISSSQFNSETTRSVRNWEPKLALVPREDTGTLTIDKLAAIDHDVLTEDKFYRQLMLLYSRKPSCKVLVMEIGDDEQAMRVVRMALRHQSVADYNCVEIWRDWPEGEAKVVAEVDERSIEIKGEGKMRAVVLFLAGANKKK